MDTKGKVQRALETGEPVDMEDGTYLCLQCSENFPKSQGDECPECLRREARDALKAIGWEPFWKAESNAFLNCRWYVGWQDRGMGHGGCVIAVDDEQSIFHRMAVIQKELSKELAEHLVEIHNNSLKETARGETKENDAR